MATRIFISLLTTEKRRVSEGDGSWAANDDALSNVFFLNFIFIILYFLLNPLREKNGIYIMIACCYQTRLVRVRGYSNGA
jgi:hypothetical protein